MYDDVALLILLQERGEENLYLSTEIPPHIFIFQKAPTTTVTAKAAKREKIIINRVLEIIL